MTEPIVGQILVAIEQAILRALAGGPLRRRELGRLTKLNHGRLWLGIQSLIEAGEIETPAGSRVSQIYALTAAGRERYEVFVGPAPVRPAAEPTRQGNLF